MLLQSANTNSERVLTFLIICTFSTASWTARDLFPVRPCCFNNFESTKQRLKEHYECKPSLLDFWCKRTRHLNMKRVSARYKHIANFNLVKTQALPSDASHIDFVLLVFIWHKEKTTKLNPEVADNLVTSHHYQLYYQLWRQTVCKQQCQRTWNF